MKVDILLPYWGEFKLLKKAVDSVINQTEAEWRLIIVDDCYPSREAEEYYSNFPDKRVTYYRHKKNMGLVKNYNFAVSKATAKHCVLMGCDDIMLPKYLETALKNIGTADYYQPGVEVIDENDTVYLPIADRIKKVLRPKRPGVYSGERIVTSLCHGNWTYFPSLMWNVSTLRKYNFDENNPNTQDLLTQFDIFCGGGSLYLDNQVTFQYRRSANSFSSKAKSGTRFVEEKEMYSTASRRFAKLGWRCASNAARLHITARLHQFLS
jgi:glycosyltransferase involved in cell wall biosynthesis